MSTNNKRTMTFHTGFTLVEILIALTLLSLIFLLVFSSLHAAGRNWEVSAKQIEMSDEFRLASQFIRKNLAQTVPLIWINEEGLLSPFLRSLPDEAIDILFERKIAFSGNSDEINFVAPLPSHRGGGGLSLLTLKTSEDEENKKLMLYYQMAVPDHQSFDINSSDDVNSAVLVEDIDTIEFSYFGSEQADDSPDWHDNWDIKDRLPLLVRMKINTNNLSTFWPEMIIAIRSQAENGQTQFYQVAATK